MKIRFIKSVFAGIKEGEVKDLPLHLAELHIEKGEAEEVKEEVEENKETKVKRSKKEKNEEI